MAMLGVFLLLLWNFAVSWFNAWSTGRSWAETKAQGGLARFMSWMVAIMSGCGFTWCYLIVLAFGAEALGKLPPAYVKGALELGYLAIIVPIIGSGLAITVQAWTYAWKQRTALNVGVAAYDTFAQIYNTYEAIEAVPEFVGDLGKLFSKSDDDDNPLVALMVLLVICALAGGALTTTLIIRSTARSYSRDTLADAYDRQVRAA
jgi:hypothetical protein